MNKPNPESKQGKMFIILEDRMWHCRGHEFAGLESGQLAGGGGIQGLQRGTKTRPGFQIETKSEHCPVCKAKTKWDRWTGKTQKANAAAGISGLLAQKILMHFGNVDVIEQRQRPVHELVIDHRVPMSRWGEAETKLSVKMSDAEIGQKFQLLKKDGSGNHNLLKSRACELCLKTGKRGTPFGIQFFYAGNSSWSEFIPAFGSEAEKGCVGCGWYDFAKWREALNLKLSSPSVSSLK